MKSLLLSLVSLALASPSIIWWIIRGYPPSTYLVFLGGVALGWMALNALIYFETKRSRTVKTFLILLGLVQIETAIFWMSTNRFPTGIAIFSSGLLASIGPWLIQVAPTLWFRKSKEVTYIVKEDILGQYIQVKNEFIRPGFESLIKTGSKVTVELKGKLCTVTRKNYGEMWENHGPDIEGESQSDKIHRYRANKHGR
jgi:hypothetical protein